VAVQPAESERHEEWEPAAIELLDSSGRKWNVFVWRKAHTDRDASFCEVLTSVQSGCFIIGSEQAAGAQSPPMGIMKSKTLSTSIPDQPFPIGIGLGKFVRGLQNHRPNDVAGFRE
jgi:hypothetical protein